MGVAHIRLAYSVKTGAPGTKAVLLAFADRACDDCGLAWPGIPYLSDRTEIGVTSTRKHIQTLVSSGLLKIHAYTKGGRGLTTEYVVLPQVAKLSTAPCGKCREFKKTLHPGSGLKRHGNDIPSNLVSETLYPGGDHPSENHNPSGEPVGNPGEKPAGSQGASAGDGSRDATMPEDTRAFLRGLGIYPPEKPKAR